MRVASCVTKIRQERQEDGLRADSEANVRIEGKLCTIPAFAVTVCPLGLFLCSTENIFETRSWFQTARRLLMKHIRVSGFCNSFRPARIRQSRAPGAALLELEELRAVHRAARGWIMRAVWQVGAV